MRRKAGKTKGSTTPDTLPLRLVGAMTGATRRPDEDALMIREAVLETATSLIRRLPTTAVLSLITVVAEYADDRPLPG